LQLCLATGWTPDQVRALSGEDYSNFRALYAIQPWGAERDNLHTAMLLAQNANMQRTKQTDPVFHPRQFMIGAEPPDKSKINAERIRALRDHIKRHQRVH
jgi:hypothetical protein